MPVIREIASPELIHKVVSVLRGQLKEKGAEDFSWLASSYAKQVHGTVQIFAKEQYSFPPILAPDFDILHRYFFPASQSKNKHLEVDEARALIDDFPHSIMVLPGTENELTRYIGNVFRIDQKIDELQRRLSADSNDSRLLGEIAEDLSRLTRSSSPGITGPETLRWISRTFSAVASGVQAVAEFLERPDVFRYRDFMRPFEDNVDRIDELTEQLQVMYSALSHPSERHKTFNIRNDAINMCAVILFHEKFGVVPSNTRDGEKFKFLDRKTIGVNLLFVSTTKRVLNGSYERFSDDRLIEFLLSRDSLKMSHVKDHHDETPHIRPFRVASILRYCEIRNRSSSAGVAKHLAIQISIDARSFGLTMEQENATQAVLESKLGNQVVASKQKEQSPTLFSSDSTLIPALILSAGSSSPDLCGSISELDEESFMELQLRKGINVFIDNLREKGVFFSEMSYVTTNGIAVTELFDELRGSWILRAERNPSTRLCSIFWRSNLNLEDALQVLSPIAEQNHPFQISTHYDRELTDLDILCAADDEGAVDLRARKQAIGVFPVSQDIVGLLPDGDFCLPEFLTLSCGSAQVNYWFPGSKVGRRDAACHFYSSDGAAIAIEFLAASCSGRGDRKLLEACVAVVERHAANFGPK